MTPPTTRAFLDLLRTADIAQVGVLLSVFPELARARDDDWGDAALGTAIARDDPALVKLLVDAGADVREQVPGVPSPFFIFARSISVAEVLEGSGARWSAPSEGAAALALAACRPQPALVEWLVARGARPGVSAFRNARYESGFLEPLLAVCPPDVLDALLVDCLGLDSDGAEPDRGRTIAVVSRLLRAGANATNTDALHRAAAGNHAEIVRILTHAGADPNRPDANGNLAIVDAAYEAAHDAVVALLEAGADPDRRNAHGQSARAAANDLGDEDLGRLLAAH